MSSSSELVYATLACVFFSLDPLERALIFFCVFVAPPRCPGLRSLVSAFVQSGTFVLRVDWPLLESKSRRLLLPPPFWRKCEPKVSTLNTVRITYPVHASQVHSHDKCFRTKVNTFGDVGDKLMVERLYAHSKIPHKQSIPGSMIQHSCK